LHCISPLRARIGDREALRLQKKKNVLETTSAFCRTASERCNSLEAVGASKDIHPHGMQD